MHKHKIIKTLSSSYGHDYAYACIMVTLVLMLVLESLVRTGLTISRMNSTCQNFDQSKTGLALERDKTCD